MAVLLLPQAVRKAPRAMMAARRAYISYSSIGASPPNLDALDGENAKFPADNTSLNGASGMAAIAFDTLKAARRLKAAGVPEEQAEVQAEIMAEAFVFNMDALVTKDYLDARLKELEARFDSTHGSELRLHRWMMAIIIATNLIPIIQGLTGSG